MSAETAKYFASSKRWVSAFAKADVRARREKGGERKPSRRAVSADAHASVGAAVRRSVRRVLATAAYSAATMIVLMSAVTPSFTSTVIVYVPTWRIGSVM